MFVAYANFNLFYSISQTFAFVPLQSTKTDIKGGKSSVTPAPPVKPPSRGKTQGTLGDREMTRSPTGILGSPVAHEDPVLDKKYKEKLYAQVRGIIQWYVAFSLVFTSRIYILYEPHHEKTCLRGLRPGKTQIGLLSYRD